MQKADIRIIAATNRDLESVVNDRQFRQDLYYRLFVYPISLPPLRERPEDLPLLTESMLRQFNHEMAKSVEGISPDAMEVLTAYQWPGNVRELQNVMERLMILSRGNVIEVDDLPRYLTESITLELSHPDNLVDIPDGFSLEQSIDEFEGRLILKALRKCNNNKSRAASLLGLSRSTFRYKLSKVKNASLKNIH